MLQAVLFDPFQDCVVALQTMHCLLEGIGVEFEETEKMFVESNGLVVVPVEQSFAMQLGLVDQTGEMDVAAEFLVRTARMQSSHGGKTKLRATAALRPAAPLTRLSFRRLSLPVTTRPE